MPSSRLFCLCSIIFTLYFAHVQPTVAQITAPWEVGALRAIKNSLNDPLGRLDTWNRGDPCVGNWSRVICENVTASDGYFHVKELQLLRLNLSGTLAPELGQLSHMKIMDFMWNKIGGSIPPEVGNITSLELLLLNGNLLTGPLPEEIGFLPNLNRIQIDQNHISGPIPKSFANLNKTKHFHMNNNSLSGQIPPELSRLPSLVHLLLDNNNLSGYIPPELSKLRKVLIIQLDNNNFSGSSIPSSYGNITTLLKLSLRNCSLEGPAPNVSGIPQLGYLDISWNQLTGPIPFGQLASNITTIDLSHNRLNGSIPGSFSGLPNLQRLSLDNNNLDGSVPSDVWRGIDFSGNRSLILDFHNNLLTNLSNPLTPPANVTIVLSGNPICTSQNQLNISRYCGSPSSLVPEGGSMDNSTLCSPCSTDLPFESILKSPNPCFCAIPLYVDYRLKSPGFWDFVPYEAQFQEYLSSGLFLSSYQLEVATFMWEEGPRLKMKLKLFPNNTILFNSSEVLRLRDMFTGWLIADSDIFGPYELIDFIPGWYDNVLPHRAKSSLSTGAIVGVVIAAFAAAAILSSLITLFILRRRSTRFSKKRNAKRIPMKIDGVKDFTFEELSNCTSDFSDSALIGQGGYGKVYRGVLADGTVAAIKRAQEGSLQGSKEFFTEIELLSRLHHRNLVSLLGYCDEEDEQMLVYEYMPNGTLRDNLSAKAKEALSFPMRLRIALGSSRGILYLHTEADPPIFHRDIKASNILLDSKFVAKVADFGLSRLAPLPETEGSAPGYVSTVVKGTPGYLDPEYFLTHKLTDKSDVYSLGVVFLELLTGMQPISHGKNLVREVVAANQSGMILSVVDMRMGSCPAECVERFAALGLRCCRDETDARPSMVEVVRELETIWQMTPETDGIPSESVAMDPSHTRSTPASSRSRMIGSIENHRPEQQNGAPPAGPRAPRRLQRRAAATGAAAANAQRAALQLPAAGTDRAACRQPASRAHRAPGRQPASRSHRSSGAHHASSGATGPGHAPSRAAGPRHPSARSHHATGHPSAGPHHPAPVSPDAASPRSHHPATVSPYHAPSCAHHPAAITAHVATTSHASSNGDTASGHGAHHPPGNLPRRDALDLSGQPQGALPRRRDEVPVLVSHALASRHADDRQRRHQRARGRRRRARGIGHRGPRRLPLS